MYRIGLIGLFALALIGCGEQTTNSAATQPPATEAPPATATLAPTPTTIAMEDVDFDTLLYEDGDLPSGFVPGQFGAVQLPKELPSPDAASSVVFSNSGKAGGSVSLVAYNDPAEISKAAPLMGPHFSKGKGVAVAGVGDESLHYDGVDFPNSTRPSEIRFTRCGVVVNAFLYYEDFDPMVTKDTVLNYVKRLDKRLKKQLCP